MSSAILDIQCVLGVKSEYKIKEMSIVDIKSCTMQHWVFKHSSLTQDAKSRSVNNWLKRRYHGLTLDCGDVEYTEIEKIFQSIKYNTIYVKGLQKNTIISEFMPYTNVMNMEDLMCPRTDNLAYDNTLPRCILHKEFHTTKCSLYKAFVLKKWFINNS